MAPHLFDFECINGGGIPLSRHVEMDVKFLCIKVPRVKCLITQNPNEVLDPKPKINYLVWWAGNWLG